MYVIMVYNISTRIYMLHYNRCVHEHGAYIISVSVYVLAYILHYRCVHEHNAYIISASVCVSVHHNVCTGICVHIVNT